MIGDRTKAAQDLSPELKQAESWLKGAADWEREEGGKRGNDAIVIADELDRLRAVVAAQAAEIERMKLAPGELCNAELLNESRPCSQAPMESLRDWTLMKQAEHAGACNRVWWNEIEVSTVLRECFAEFSTQTVRVAERPKVDEPSKMSVEGAARSDVPIDKLLSGEDDRSENAYVLVPAKLMIGMVREHEQLTWTCAALWEALNDISDRIDSQNDVDGLHLGGGWEVLNDIAARIARLRTVQKDRNTSKTVRRTRWVHAKDHNDAHNTYQNGYDYLDREICRGAAQIAEEILYRVDILVTKEPDMKAGEPGPGSSAGGSS
jgi:hypothetical protein